MSQDETQKQILAELKQLREAEDIRKRQDEVRSKIFEKLRAEMNEQVASLKDTQAQIQQSFQNEMTALRDAHTKLLVSDKSQTQSIRNQRKALTLLASLIGLGLFLSREDLGFLAKYEEELHDVAAVLISGSLLGGVPLLAGSSNDGRSLLITWLKGAAETLDESDEKDEPA